MEGWNRTRRNVRARGRQQFIVAKRGCPRQFACARSSEVVLSCKLLSIDRERAKHCVGPMLQCVEVAPALRWRCWRCRKEPGTVAKKLAEVQDLTHYVGRYCATPI